MSLWAWAKAKSLRGLPGGPGWAAQARLSLDYSYNVNRSYCLIGLMQLIAAVLDRLIIHCGLSSETNTFCRAGARSQFSEVETLLIFHNFAGLR
jgi:hypothetical protein